MAERICSMRCLSCGHDTTKGKVFRNILKTISSEAYQGVKTITLHCKCPGCATAIIIETDPKNKNYGIVKEAKKVKKDFSKTVGIKRKNDIQ
ncbi:hypothetical protein IG631_00317 [Alternaria alternata]|nr:hypothetical protein IG631_00317 [Alternaria alternata]